MQLAKSTTTAIFLIASMGASSGVWAQDNKPDLQQLNQPEPGHKLVAAIESLRSAVESQQSIIDMQKRTLFQQNDKLEDLQRVNEAQHTQIGLLVKELSAIRADMSLLHLTVQR